MPRILCTLKDEIYGEEVQEANEVTLETEADKQLKVILQKQLNTHLSIEEQFSKHRTFVTPSTYKPLTELVQGSCSLEKFRELEVHEELHQELQRCGLTEDEIEDYLVYKSGKKSENRLVNPSIWRENIARIEEKIENHNKELLKPQSFQNVKKLTRHEMEIERTLYAGCAEKGKLATLLSVEDTCEDSYTSDAYSYIKDLSIKLLQKSNRKRKKRKLDHQEISKSESVTDDTEDFHYDSNIHHVVVPLEDSEVAEKRLSVEEIRKIPRFENYKTGEASKILYIKNLHPKTTANELRSLFGIFEEENNTPVDYRICTGRMKGQAFVTFSNTEVAKKALLHGNGFMVRAKPLIIEFGKKT